MSLATICREAAAEAGVAPPAAVIGSAETVAIRLLAAARQEIFSMAESASWSALAREHRFVPAASAAQPDGLPDDFARIVDGTVWDRTGARPLAGPLTAQQWQAARASGVGAAARPAFRIFAGAFHLHPAPARAGGEIAFEYVTGHIVAAADGAGRRTWEADDDSFVLSEDIATMGVKWRFKKAVGPRLRRRPRRVPLGAGPRDRATAAARCCGRTARRRCPLQRRFPKAISRRTDDAQATTRAA